MTVHGAWFVAVGVVLLVLSRKSLRRPHTHGFYRLFVFESILALLWLNLPYWSQNPDSLQQGLASGLQYLSLYLLLHSLYLLLRRGGHSRRRAEEANFAFENTAQLVDSSLYRYIRHPMYGSLLFLLWGCYLKGPGLSASVLVVLGTWALFRTARIEEGENIRAFGQAYRDYIGRTRMFIPYLL